MEESFTIKVLNFLDGLLEILGDLVESAASGIMKIDDTNPFGIFFGIILFTFLPVILVARLLLWLLVKLLKLVARMKNAR